MKLKTEILDKKPSILIVSQKKSSFIELLKITLIKLRAEIFFSTKLPNRIDHFDYCFLINQKLSSEKKGFLKNKKIVLFFVNDDKLAQLHFSFTRKVGFKIINLTGGSTKKEHIDRLLWFIFSQSKENYLRMEIPKPYREKSSSLNLKKLFPPFGFTKKKLAFYFLSLFFVSHLLFFLPLSLATLSFYQSINFLKKEQFSHAEKFLTFGETFLTFSQILYSPVRPTYSFFSLALILDSAVDLSKNAKSLISHSLILQKNIPQIIKLVLKSDKESQDKNTLFLRLKRLTLDLTAISDSLDIVYQKISSLPILSSSFKENIFTAKQTANQLKKISPYLPQILALDTQKKYLFLFANNRELRPGGGFIGSFGIMTIKDLTLLPIKVYDVYDADGQLTAHIEPPAPLKKYLNQPHWFLRDSAFSPDFLENYVQAKYFLEKEMGFTNFSGGLLFTTSAIENILEAFGDLELPDFGEIINSKNFYLKAQTYAEKDFFPGSTKKKNFLGSLTRQLFINWENASFKNLIIALKKSLDEKQLVIYLDDPKIQNIFDSNYWSGRLIDPKCAITEESCISDYLFPFDANLGVNKANYYLDRYFDLVVNIDKNGVINHLLSAQVKNNSPLGGFPGGIYKNYFQVFLPSKTTVKQITKDGVLIDDFDEEEENFKKIGFYLELPPQSLSEIKINYVAGTNISRGSYRYQLIVQKQIGASNNDFSFRITLPSNIHLISQNFSALVKNNQIIYNTSLSTEKIFFLDLIKE